MTFIKIKRTVIATHRLIAVGTAVFKHDFVAAHHQDCVFAFLIMNRHYLSFPQPVPLKIAGVAVNTRIMGVEQCSTGLAAALIECSNSCVCPQTMHS